LRRRGNLDDIVRERFGRRPHLRAVAARQATKGNAKTVAAIDWPRGKPVRVITPPGAMKVSVGSGANWFAVDGELRIDEGRVLGLQKLMKLAHESRRGRFVALAIASTWRSPNACASNWPTCRPCRKSKRASCGCPARRRPFWPRRWKAAN